MGFELDEVIRKINSKYEGKVGIASKMIAERLPRLECGIAALDLALGGGFPIGRISMLWGPRSGGKTTVCVKLMASAQRTCRHCYLPMIGNKPQCEGHKFEAMVVFFADVEGAYDYAWAKKLGVDNDKVLFSRPESGEEAGDIVDAMVRVPGVDVIFLDSIAAMIPTKEIETSFDEQQMGIQARLVNKLVRKIVSGMNGFTEGPKKTVILTNQVRQKIGLVFGDPEVMPGGKGQEFVTSVEVKFRASKPILKGDEEFPVAVTSSFIVKKNKTGVANMEGEYVMFVRDSDKNKAGNINNGEFISYMGIKYGLLSKEGAVYKFGENDLGKNKDGLAELLDQDNDLTRRIKKGVFDFVLGRVQVAEGEKKTD